MDEGDENSLPMEHLLQLESMLSAGSWRSTPDGIWFSSSLFELFKIEPSDDPREMFTDRLYPVVHPDDRASLIDFVRGMDSGHDSIVFRVNVDGSYRTFRAEATDGVDARFGLVRDITTERTLERERRQAEARFQTLAESLPSGIYVGSVDGTPEYANPAMLKLLRVERAEDINWIDLIHQDDMAWLSSRYAEFMDQVDSEPFRFRIVVEGDIRHVECRLGLLGGERPRIVSNIVDQTEWYSREKRLAESEKQLRWSQQISKTASWFMDFADGKVIWSQQLFRLLGRDEDAGSVSPETFRDHIAPESLAESDEVVQSVSSTPGKYDYVVQLIRTDGKRLWARSVGESVVDPTNPSRVIGMRGVLQDITDMHELEERVRRAEKLQALGELAGGIAHDFNNMLAAVLGNAEVLANELDGEQLADCREIIKSARRCSDLTNQLLAFSRRRPLQAQNFDIAQSIEAVLGLLQHGVTKRFDTQVDVPPNVPLILGSPSQIENALLNVCINAVQAMDDLGTISIRVETVELDPKDWGDEFDITAGPGVAIHIQDDGPGIRSEILDRVLDPFFSTRRDAGGTGLGLATTFGTARNHGGALAIDSVPGEGTTVTLVLPQAPPDATLSEDSEPLENPLDGKSALVVDDELAVRRVVCRHLDSFNVSADSAGGHREALECIEARAKAGASYDLAIIDLSMPDGRGTATASAFLEKWPDSSVLLISGFDLNVALDATNNIAVLQKPFTRTALARALVDAQAKSGQ